MTERAKFIALAVVAGFERGVEVYTLDENGIVWRQRPTEHDAHWTPLPDDRREA